MVLLAIKIRTNPVLFVYCRDYYISAMAIVFG